MYPATYVVWHMHMCVYLPRPYEKYEMAELADFNLCHKAEEITSQTPVFRALYDIAEDNSICGYHILPCH
jgi:hypothetical protein